MYIVDVEIKVARNVILNNFDISVRIARVHSFPSRRIQNWQKFTIFCNLPEFLQLWILLEGERCTLANRSLRSKLFKMTFLTTFISTSTMYNQNWKRWFFFFFNNSKSSFSRYKIFSPHFLWAYPSLFSPKYIVLTKSKVI